MRADVIVRQREAMARAGLDALVAISPENFAYTTGFVVPSQPILRWRHAMAIVTSDGRAAVVCVDMEETTVRARVADVPIHVWGEFTDDSMAILAAALRSLGLAAGRVGLEYDYLPAGDFERLGRHLPEARFAPAERLYDRLRQVKTPAEIEHLHRLSRIADQAIGDAFRAVRTGMTEMDLAAALTRSVYVQGAEQFRLMIVATGERSQLPNVGPTGRVLRPGDVCRVEIFAMIGGYHAGVCRTAVVEKAPDGAEAIWRNLVECRQLLLGAIRPGAGTRALYEAFLTKFGELGLPPISFVGHGIGLHLHEAPYLGPYSDGALEAGMVLGIEPLVYRTGKGYGLQLKDMVAVTETGCRLLSDRTDNESLLVIPAR